jgi:GNAT superfamily N-acetyltransferase
MQISTVRPAALDADTADELAGLCNRAAAVDAPHMPEETGEILRARLLHGWDGEGAVSVLLARAGDGRLLGMAGLEMPEQENRGLIWFNLVVEPEVRRHGVGSALLDAVTGVSAEVGRGLLMTGTWHSSPGVTFLKQHGFEQASIAAQRRLYPQQLPREPDAALLEQARAASADYDIVRLFGPLPEDMLEAVLPMAEQINDAPLDDLELEDDNFTVGRLRRYDAAQVAQQQRLYRVLALDPADGSPAAHSVVAVDGRRPFHGEQHDTTVRREHRGHRLGLRLKLEMLAWLREAEPQLRQIDTWNQESNVHMIAVNDAIGCIAVGRELEFQRGCRQVTAGRRTPG